jgi:AAT family amino acid transporter
MSSNASAVDSSLTHAGEAGEGFNYLYGVINLVVVFCLVWALWYIFMHANGVLKLYTPMYGFSLVAMLTASVILLNKVLGWPGGGSQASGAGPALSQGIWGTLISLALVLVTYYVVLRGFLGDFGIAYFSPSALLAGGGTGAEPWNAREWSSTAILYLCTAFIWWALAWGLGFGDWPWQNNKPVVRGFSRLCVVLFLSGLTFFVLFHPHVCVLFPRPRAWPGPSPGGRAGLRQPAPFMGWALCYAAPSGWCIQTCFGRADPGPCWIVTARAGLSGGWLPLWAPSF